ncbi:hypothetical protein [Candidatus Halobonum tyrrellensis]|uniref:ArsR family transcriptional regulator n=1 Tax=Candidatus Halobonum tyrrellensis G22 TaxID=1324957 RepID=V4HIL9_9EURY|nr:hypothetical protein [Candidatus Halobonum tyrrellensis]ESP89633.1 hypothetical protein K933_02911 [Candidatus Halobonum tyrrellensis G22]
MIDTLLTAMADPTRRRVLGRLEPLDAGRTLAVDDLFDDGDDDADRLRLRHVHLPKLAEADLVDWDREAARIGVGADFERALPLLRAAREVETGVGPGAGAASESGRAGR